EAAAHEERGERAGRDSRLAPRGFAPARAVAGVETLEVDAVVDDGQPLRRHAVERGDLAPPGLGYRDDARRAREDPALERQDDPMVESTGARSGFAREVSLVAALARAIDVLAERSLVALDHIPASACDGPPRARGERQYARRRRQRRERESVEGYAPHRRLAARAQQVHVVPVLDECLDQTGRRALDAPVEDEGPRNDEKLHGRPVSRSSSGNRVARATRKL